MLETFILPPQIFGSKANKCSESQSKTTHFNLFAADTQQSTTTVISISASSTWLRANVQDFN
jgi:hypothetical protein